MPTEYDNYGGDETNNDHDDEGNGNDDDDDDDDECRNHCEDGDNDYGTEYYNATVDDDVRVIKPIKCGINTYYKT